MANTDPILAKLSQLEDSKVRVDEARVTGIQPTVLDNGLSNIEMLLSYTPQPGDIVRVLRIGTYSLILGAVAQVPRPDRIQDTTPPPIPDKPPATGTTLIRAVDAATWRGGRWWRANAHVYAGNWGYGVNHGYWFYPQASFGSLAGVTVTGIKIFLPARPGAGPSQATPGVFVCHTSTTRGTSEPAITGATTTLSTPADGQSAWLPLPVAFGQALVAGQAKGVATISNTRAEYQIYAGLTGAEANPLSGALQISWIRK